MTEIANYIFSSLETHDRNIKFIRTNFNRKTRKLALALIVHMMVTKIYIQNQNNKIKLLNKRIKELERQEGD